MPYYFTRAFSYCPNKPRHPLLKLMFGLLGLMLLAVLLVFGVVFAVGMLVLATVRRMRRGQPARAAAATPTNVIDGEFQVVGQAANARLG